MHGDEREREIVDMNMSHKHDARALYVFLHSAQLSQLGSGKLPGLSFDSFVYDTPPTK